MKPNELEKLYQNACFVKGFEPNDGQFKVWKQVLGWIERIDLEEALTRWYEAETSFPMPAELKPLAMQAKQRRENKAAQALDYVRRQCPVCGVTTVDYNLPSDDAIRICRSSYTPLGFNRPRSLPHGQSCGAVMNEVERRPMERGEEA